MSHPENDPRGFRRQYASIEEFERACGTDPDYVEERLNAMHGRVLEPGEIRWPPTPGPTASDPNG